MSKIQKKLLVAFLAVAFFAMYGSMEVVHAKTASVVETQEKYTEENDDPLYEGRPNMDDEFAPFMLRRSSNGYVHNDRFDSSVIRNGVDVSYYQGYIDWNTVKNSGIEFAIIRVGYRGYSSGALVEDKYFRANIEHALAAGIRVGVYIYSQAVNPAEATEEANFVLSRIAGYNITLPIVIDFEYASSNGQSAGRLYNANLSADEATAVCAKFGETVKAAGYDAMIYANKWMLSSKMNAEALSRNYKIWLANYTTKTDYAGTYHFWQYTSKGSVNGITGNVDCNFWYDDSSMYGGLDYSSVYDYKYYISKNRDVNNAYPNNPQAVFMHFIYNGMNEGRLAKDTFNVYAYKAQNPDLRRAFGNDLRKYYEHYITNGIKEGRTATGSTAVKGATVTYGITDYSSVYNYDYYIADNPDVYAKYGDDDLSIIEHFVVNGMREGRRANADFDVNAYRVQNADLRRAYGNDPQKYYMHYMTVGRFEGRCKTGRTDYITVAGGIDFSDVYDVNYYLNQNPDLKAAFGSDDLAAFEHFINQGLMEGRVSKDSFNVFAYKSNNPDLSAAFGDDLRRYYIHYVTQGKNEGRVANGTVADNSTVLNGIDYAHVYDYDYYLANNSDVAQAFGSNKAEALKHFVNQGMTEGRIASSEFNVQIYKSNYSDLSNAYGNDLRAYYIHYMTQGVFEGRSADRVAKLSIVDALKSVLINDSKDIKVQEETTESTEEITESTEEIVTEGTEEATESTEEIVMEGTEEATESTEEIVTEGTEEATESTEEIVTEGTEEATESTEEIVTEDTEEVIEEVM